MTMHEPPDLYKRVERYEAALAELRAAHQDVRSVLLDQVLYERWEQLGAELGFTLGQAPVAQHGTGAEPPQQVESLSHAIPQMSEAWAS